MKTDRESLDEAIAKVTKRTVEEEADREIKEALELMRSSKRTAGLLPWETIPEVM